MNIGIIVYSQTGNTHSVASKLAEKLVTAGHTADLERLQVVGEDKPGTPNVRFESLPDLEQYDALVLGAPVHGFSLSIGMQSYLSQCSSFVGKQVAFLITQHFPYAWMGGNRAVKQMKKACQSKGADVCGSGIVNWSRQDREQRIVQVIDELAQVF